MKYFTLIIQETKEGTAIPTLYSHEEDLDAAKAQYHEELEYNQKAKTLKKDIVAVIDDKLNFIPGYSEVWENSSTESEN